MVAAGFVNIEQDRLFDFVHVHDVMRTVETIIKNKICDKITTVVPDMKIKLSDFASYHGANYTIKLPGLGRPYVYPIPSS
jgi:hypothetical protein